MEFLKGMERYSGGDCQVGGWSFGGRMEKYRGGIKLNSNLMRVEFLMRV